MRKSAYGTPLVIKDGGDPIVLSKVEVRDGSYDEKFIQELAFSHPSCLPISEIDRAYEELATIEDLYSVLFGPKKNSQGEEAGADS